MSPAASSSRTDAPGVVELDRLSERLLAASAALRTERARTPPELEAVHRLRYAHVVREGWRSAGDLPAGLERDDFDADAIQVASWDGETLVGTVRLVLPVRGRRLPVEDAYELLIEPAGSVVEVGRLLISADRRGDPVHRAWGALFARAWLEIRAAGFQVMAGTATATMVARFRALGLPFEILGPARPYWGEERHPVRLDPAGAEPSWYGVTARDGPGAGGGGAGGGPGAATR